MCMDTVCWPEPDQRQLSLDGIAAKVCGVDEVVKLLSALEDSKYHVGNPEAKLHACS